MSMKVRRNGVHSVLKNVKYVYESSRDISTSRIYKDRKEKVVILGSGWGGIHFFINIDFKKYDVTLISPRSYFTFTPLLPCLCSGTLSAKVCTENVSTFLKKKGSSGKYLQMECTDISPEERQVICRDNKNNEVKIAYDHLVISVGAKTNSFNIKGVDKHAFFVKDIEGVINIRKRFLDVLDICCTDKISNEEKKKLLHVVVVGGGPTGVEVAGEFADFINKDVKKKYKNIFPLISVSIIEGGKNLLPTFTQNISDFTKRTFHTANINVLTNYYVKEVDEDTICVQSSLDQNEKKKQIPYGLLIWASGLAQTPLITNFLKKIPEQVNNRILNVNGHLAVIGIKEQNIYAIGDCKKIQPLQLHQNFHEVLDYFSSSSTTFSSDLLKSKANELSKKFPQVSQSKWDYKKNKKTQMDKHQFCEYLKEIDENYKSPIPTAQNAKQEAYFLSNLFNTLMDKKADGHQFPSFVEKWKGSIAYIGSHQVVAHLPFFEITGGLFSFTFWKMVYIQLLLTWRSRFAFIMDFLRIKFFGRPFSK
ncbi:type II NADH:ubiquinone oxidoreductase, putative [Plasmodium knowlesi strain H]|uniref:NADH:ubiquinone reductase (non-electrogenic) n=3 Tax=Plasmodium knowlesi TaxID=5850 RepID=A0A5K1VNU3_PLAKH|nr:type II NADH:ubiquinone oxidoreductase, putative [Plasmodium knowlesi strain H]OTN67496.1 putative Nadh dehydrogenase [Plasmodium knowlesi]CAA9987421.1 type II NADH:ubiquinone oxidoreductase, putative [Plasmodium knowlesi strain H]SBO23275.1 type II NADH:ubiquinone oxidoreductase, putative [Plasmodium knowlesi strain H]SBO24260.1 type II NADH:ubiquinone oxidoreductase, putative [Plasmodium knowlesi strain H]VVS76895.1 type II NADH:ubiquinone oxidoreductase, putative [Plasmodium knowlesi str|eukprot:XP_002258422.1 nadh dehydrogenase, putative [Plasmodium knowlesi strain H]